MSRVERAKAAIADNYAIVAGAILGYVVGAEAGVWSYPSIPEGSMIVATAAVIALGAGYVAAGRITDLLPDEDGIYIVEYDDRENGGGALFEVSEDKWSAVEADGELHQWEDSPKRVYECVSFDPEEERIRGNWRASKPASALNAEPTVEDVLLSIRELRDHFEAMGQESKAIKRSLRAIIRDLEKQRAREQNRILDEHTAPTMGDEQTIDELIEQHIPADIRPKIVDPEGDGDGEQPGEHVGLEFLDDAEALDPVGADD